MHRLAAATHELARERPALSAEAMRHLKVLRPKDGEEIELFDGCGATRLCRYDARAKELVAAAPVVVRAARRVRVTLFACVTKGARWDWTVEKATELGVARIVPVLSARTIVRIGAAERAAKRERWQKIAEEAARQSDAVWLPEVAEPVTFAAALERVKGTTCFVGALTEPKSAPLAAAVAQALEKTDCADCALFVGPEGDFTPDELAALVAVAVPTSFGETILRAETAAIYGLSVLTAALDAAHAKGANTR